MSGIPEQNKPAFAKAEQAFKEKEYDVQNPASTPRKEGTKYSTYMRYSLGMLHKADLMVVLEGWEKSPGACFEYLTALVIGTPVFKADTEDCSSLSSIEPELSFITTACVNITLKIWKDILNRE
jgi:hypothetical protein